MTPVRDHPEAATPGDPATIGVAEPSDRRALLFEVLAVVALGIGPPMVMALCELLRSDPPPPRTVGDDALYFVLRSIQVCGPLLYIMWRSGQPWAFYGLRRLRWRDPAIALLLFAIGYSAYIMVASGFSLSGSMGFHARPATQFGLPLPGTPWEWCLIGLIAVTNGFTEELTVRDT